MSLGLERLPGMKFHVEINVLERDFRSQPPRRDAIPTRWYHTAIMTFFFSFFFFFLGVRLFSWSPTKVN